MGSLIGSRVTGELARLIVVSFQAFFLSLKIIPGRFKYSLSWLL